MLYKFKSRATADVIMLEPNGRQLVQTMGKTPGQSGITAIEAAIAAEERMAAPDDAQDSEDGPDPADAVGQRQRAAPLLDMLRRSAAEGREVTW